MLASTQSRSALGWLRDLRLDELTHGEARLSILPGRRDMARFIGDRQRAQLAQMLGEIVGRPVKVQVNLASADDRSQGSAADDDADAPPHGASRGGGAISAAQRQQVMALPLVRQLMESFDVSLVEVRKDTPKLPDGSAEDGGQDDSQAPPASDHAYLDDETLDFHEDDTDV